MCINTSTGWPKQKIKNKNKRRCNTLGTVVASGHPTIHHDWPVGGFAMRAAVNNAGRGWRDAASQPAREGGGDGEMAGQREGNLPKNAFPSSRECHTYLGRCNGPYTHTERQSLLCFQCVLWSSPVACAVLQCMLVSFQIPPSIHPVCHLPLSPFSLLIARVHHSIISSSHLTLAIARVHHPSSFSSSSSPPFLLLRR